MARTKITAVNANHVTLLATLGLEVTESTPSTMVVTGTPAEIAEAMTTARETIDADAWDGARDGQLFGTLMRKLTSGKGVKAIEDAPAEEDTEENTVGEDEPVIEEFFGDNSPAETDEEAEAVMLADADAQEAAAGEAQAADAAPAQAPHTRDECEDLDACTAEHQAAKPVRATKAEPKRAPLPEGYTTPVGLAKIITARGLYRGRREDGVLTSQSMYVYIKNNGAGSAHPFPLENIAGRDCMKIEAGVQWWTEHQERVAEKARIAQERKDAAAKKAQKKTAGE